MILIGSRALMMRAPQLLSKPPRDFDFIASEQEAISWFDSKEMQYETLDGKFICRDEPTPVEFELLEARKSNELFVDIVNSDKQTITLPGFGKVPNIDLLFTLKASHRFLKNSPFFWKTAVDYHKLKDIGAKIRPEYQEFFKMREKETYNYSHPKLNVKKDEFFSRDGVNYIFDHDSIHCSMALFDKPAYLYYAKDGEEVKSDKEKFFKCNREIQLAGCVEEACVLAIERSLVPYPGKMNAKQAWIYSLSKISSSVTSGFFRNYIYENIFEIIKLYPENYWEKFQKDLGEGKIRKI